MTAAARRLIDLTDVELRALIAEEVRQAVSANQQAPALEYLTIAQLAERLGCSKQSIRNWAATEGLPYVDMGKTRRYPLSEVMAWLKGRKIRAVR